MAYFDRFDIAEAYYVFASLWHNGQDSQEYAIFGRLSRIGFKPSPMLGAPEDLEENAQEIYLDLVEKYNPNQCVNCGGDRDSIYKLCQSCFENIPEWLEEFTN